MLKQQQQQQQAAQQQVLDKNPRQYQVAAERRNRFEEEALQRRLDFLQWRETNLLAKHTTRYNDLRRSLALFKVTSGSSGHSEPCPGQPAGYPRLRLGLAYHERAAVAAAAAGAPGGRYKTPNLVREGREAIKWDLQRLRPVEAVSPADKELFSLDNMTRWRGREEGWGRQLKYVRLPVLESLPNGFHQSVRRAEFTVAKARGCSGRLAHHLESLPELQRQRDIRRARRRNPERKFIEDSAVAAPVQNRKAPAKGGSDDIVEEDEEEEDEDEEVSEEEAAGRQRRGNKTH